MSSPTVVTPDIMQEDARAGFQPRSRLYEGTRLWMRGLNWGVDSGVYPGHCPGSLSTPRGSLYLSSKFEVR